MKNCPHKKFDAQVDVNRFEDTGGFLAEVHIKCLDCDLPFKFLGLPMGMNLQGAAVDVDGQEARLAIAPSDATVLPGGIGFLVKLHEQKH